MKRAIFMSKQSGHHLYDHTNAVLGMYAKHLFLAMPLPRQCLFYQSPARLH